MPAPTTLAPFTTMTAQEQAEHLVYGHGLSHQSVDPHHTGWIVTDAHAVEYWCEAGEELRIWMHELYTDPPGAQWSQATHVHTSSPPA